MVPTPDLTTPAPAEGGFSVSHQKVELDINPVSRFVKGRTELTVIPQDSDFRTIRLNCRQCNITNVLVKTKPAGAVQYQDPYERAQLPYKATVRQYAQVLERIEGRLRDGSDTELIISLNKNVKIEAVDPSSENIHGALSRKTTAHDREDAEDISAVDFAQAARMNPDQPVQFQPIKVNIEFNIPRARNGIHFVGLEDGDFRYPHFYSTASSLPGSACCIFPCVDRLTSRSTWEISFKCPRTVGDAFKGPPRKPKLVFGKNRATQNGISASSLTTNELPNTFTSEDKALELSVICTGELTDEIIDPLDSSKKTTSFICNSQISAQHVGFAIGPFERVELAKYREGGEEDRLGTHAVPVNAFCLPGRSTEVENTCFPLAKAIDFFSMTYSSYPFSEYSLCFVDDVHPDILHTGHLSICSNHLLFPENVIEPLYRVTRQLVHALASQWVGINIVPNSSEDIWAVVGMSYYMTDIFMKKICGNNEYRYNQKKASDRVVDLDVGRSSLKDTGALVDLDPSEMDFMNSKAPLVLFILDQRLKKSGHSGLSRIITRFLLQVKTGDLQDGALTSSAFKRMCEKIGHINLETFFEQWVNGVGCPKFRVQQRFNKKKLVVEMSIHQVQADSVQPRDLMPETFMRDLKEDSRQVEVFPPQPVFTGPMTIRIHEADGTPYEHIIEIKDSTTRFDVPYNTKYKRLKRTRRQKEKALTAVGAEYAGEGTDDVLLYSLGDVLQAEEEIRDWRIHDWSPDDEERMSQESYEWIRMDADFEWICKISLQMPPYMWVSQLQQDRDVIAQLETIQYLASQNGHPLISSICIRTLMDSRYFYGIRIAAASVLAKCARDEIGWIGLFHLEKAFQELFCYPDSAMPRRNDFSDRASYYMQCAIPRAISRIRDNSGRAIPRVRSFFLEKLRFNDNSNNEYSDVHYLALLMRALADTVATVPPVHANDIDENDLTSIEDDPRFRTSCLEEIERHRRSDEWIPSYHNVLSTTALDCKRILMRAGIIPTEPRDFLEYTSGNTSDLLTLSAFSNLLELGTIKQEPIIRWFFYVLGNDPSPYIRQQMIRILGRTLGALAVGKDPSSSVSTAQSAATNGDSSGLIIEQEGESATNARAALLARKQTLPGAKAALQVEISENQAFSKALWDATISDVLSIEQMIELLDICEALYEPKSSAVVELKYPRYWRCKKVGKGKVKFTKDGGIRTHPMPEQKWPPAASKQQPRPPLHRPAPPSHISSSHSNSAAASASTPTGGSRSGSTSAYPFFATSAAKDKPVADNPHVSPASTSSQPPSNPQPQKRMSFSLSKPRPPPGLTPMLKREHSSSSSIPENVATATAGRSMLKPPKQKVKISSSQSPSQPQSQSQSPSQTQSQPQPQQPPKKPSLARIASTSSIDSESAGAGTGTGSEASEGQSQKQSQSQSQRQSTEPGGGGPAKVILKFKMPKPPSSSAS